MENNVNVATVARIIQGDCLDVLPTLATASVQSVVTSPPYFAQRDYKIPPTAWPEIRYQPMTGLGDFQLNTPAWVGCLGDEPNVEQYIAHLIHVFRLVRSVLKQDGTVWLNLGDKYAQDSKHGGTTGGKHRKALQGGNDVMRGKRQTAVADKQLLGVPWRVALALQTDGWFLRSDIIWHKINCMPAPLRDRPVTSHEYLFLLAKGPSYYYDFEAVKVIAARPGDVQTFGGNKGQAYQPDQTDPNYRAGSEQWGRTVTTGATRNLRTVLSVASQPYPGAHTAVMPEALVEPCILAGTRPGDTVLDPFAGSGTVLRVATKHLRNSCGIEIKSDHCEQIFSRVNGAQLDMSDYLEFFSLEAGAV